MARERAGASAELWPASRASRADGLCRLLLLLVSQMRANKHRRAHGVQAMQCLRRRCCHLKAFCAIPTHPQKEEARRKRNKRRKNPSSVQSQRYMLALVPLSVLVGGFVGLCDCRACAPMARNIPKGGNHVDTHSESVASVHAQTNTTRTPLNHRPPETPAPTKSAPGQNSAPPGSPGDTASGVPSTADLTQQPRSLPLTASQSSVHLQHHPALAPPSSEALGGPPSLAAVGSAAWAVGSNPPYPGSVAAIQAGIPASARHSASYGPPPQQMYGGPPPGARPGPGPPMGMGMGMGGGSVDDFRGGYPPHQPAPRPGSDAMPYPPSSADYYRAPPPAQEGPYYGGSGEGGGGPGAQQQYGAAHGSPPSRVSVNHAMESARYGQHPQHQQSQPPPPPQQHHHGPPPLAMLQQQQPGPGPHRGNYPPGPNPPGAQEHTAGPVPPQSMQRRGAPPPPPAPQQQQHPARSESPRGGPPYVSYHAGGPVPPPPTAHGQGWGPAAPGYVRYSTGPPPPESHPQQHPGPVYVYGVPSQGGPPPEAPMRSSMGPPPPSGPPTQQQYPQRHPMDYPASAPQPGAEPGPAMQGGHPPPPMGYGHSYARPQYADGGYPGACSLPQFLSSGADILRLLLVSDCIQTL